MFPAQYPQYQRCLLLFAAATVASVASTTRASGLTAALSYQPLELGVAQQALTRAEGEFERARLGLSGSVGVDPSVGYTNEVVEPEGAPELETSVTLSAAIDYRFDTAEILRRELELLGARERHQDIVLSGVRDALIAYADLYEARLASAVAQQNHERYTSLQEEAQRRLAIGEVSETEVARAELDTQTGQIALELAGLELRDAQMRAEGFGLSGTERFQPVRFSLPAADVQTTFAFRRAQLEVQRAEALAMQSSLFGVLEGAGVSARYRGDNYEVSGTAGVIGSRPGVSIRSRYLETAPDSWTVSLGATLRLDDRTVDDFSSAGQNINTANEAVNSAVQVFRQGVSGVRRAVTFAEHNLDLSRQRLELDTRAIGAFETEFPLLPGRLEEARERLASLEQQLADLDAQRAEMTEPDQREAFEERVSATRTIVGEASTAVRDAESAVSNAERDLENARISRNRSEEGLYRAWIDYVARVYDYLALTDEVWRLK